MAEPDETLPPKLVRLGSYSLQRKIGQGGMGEVYEARHTELDRVVALKTMRLDQGDSAEFVSRFKRERRLIAQVDSPHVVRVTDAGFDSGIHYLVMECLKGNDLSSIVRSDGPMEPERSAEIIRQSLNGLAAINQCGLMHRDIKPSNLFLGDDGVIKILDLGLAKTQRSSQSTHVGSLTLDNHFVGTPDFVSPEQAQGERDLDIRTDIYALGCVWYFLLTGKAPYSGENYSNVHLKIAAHIKDPFPSTVELNIPPGFRSVLDRMTAKDIAVRAADPSALARELENQNGTIFLANLPQLAETSVQNSHPTKRVAESKDLSISVSRRSAIAGGIGILAVAGTAMLLPLFNTASAPEQSEIGPSEATGLTSELASENIQNNSPENKEVLAKLLLRNPGLKPENCQFRINEGGSLVLELESKSLVDLAPIANSRVEILMIKSSSISDLSPVEDLPNLQILQCTDTNQLKSLEPLRDVSLSNLQIHGTAVKDLSPLRGKQIDTLDCHGCPLEDLSPLQGMPLHYLDINGTRVSNLGELGLMDELEFIDCTDTRVVDLKPLLKFPGLYTVYANERVLKDAKYLLDHPNAKSLKCNGKTLSSFFQATGK